MTHDHDHHEHDAHEHQRDDERHPGREARRHRREFIARLMDNPQQERAWLSTLGFTGGFAACRGVTHAIRHHIPPFHNFSSKGGTHIHHSTFGIFGLLGIGFLWAQQVWTGHDDPPRWGSRITATTFGLAAALTLDEFALWLDLHDDYWDAQGRKSIDAVVIFGGLLSLVVIGYETVDELDEMPKAVQWLTRFDIRKSLPASQSGPKSSQASSPAHGTNGHGPSAPASTDA